MGEVHLGMATGSGRRTLVQHLATNLLSSGFIGVSAETCREGVGEGVLESLIEGLLYQAFDGTDGTSQRSLSLMRTRSTG